MYNELIYQFFTIRLSSNSLHAIQIGVWLIPSTPVVQILVDTHVTITVFARTHKLSLHAHTLPPLTRTQNLLSHHSTTSPESAIGSQHTGVAGEQAVNLRRHWRLQSGLFRKLCAAQEELAVLEPARPVALATSAASVWPSWHVAVLLFQTRTALRYNNYCWLWVCELLCITFFRSVNYFTLFSLSSNSSLVFQEYWRQC